MLCWKDKGQQWQSSVTYYSLEDVEYALWTQQYLPCPLKHMRTLIHTFAFEEELDKIDIIIVSNTLLKEELLINEQQKLLNKDEYIYVYNFFRYS